ncbi:MAG: NAD-dependent epimerase/dehydratase family protein [Aureliella sp.]
MRVLIVGCGYVGSEVVRQAPEGTQVSVLTRSRERFEELRQLGVEPVYGHWLASPEHLAAGGDSSANWSDDASAAWAANPPKADAILVAVPHRADSSGGDEDGEQTHVVGLQNLEGAYRKANQQPPRLIYLSTTGVYGQADDCEVNEQTPVSPTRIGPRIAVAAERWLQQNSNWESQILRLAGIYGPGRIPLAARLRGGEALTVPQDGYLNLIHVTDIARVIWRLMQGDTTGKLYVLSDGVPVLRKEFYCFLASLCGVKDPVFEAPDPTSPRARRAGNKRVNPERILRELAVNLQFPDYQSGLRQAIGED